jgi:hypothetical protein
MRQALARDRIALLGLVVVLPAGGVWFATTWLSCVWVNPGRNGMGKVVRHDGRAG